MGALKFTAFSTDKFVITAIPIYGEKSQNVRIVQLALIERGFDCGPAGADGIFWEGTRKAASKFQKSFGLPGSGLPGPQTIDLLGIKVVPLIVEVPKDGGLAFQPDTGRTISSGHDADEGTLDWYFRMYWNCGIDKGREAAVASAGKYILANKKRYDEVERWTGVPWFVVGILHYKEASGRFDRVLHNGETLTSVNLYGTKKVPAGRGKGKNWTWEQAAVDAIMSNPARWAKLRTGSKSVADFLWAMERYNGTGYITGGGKDDVSAYIWDSSNVHDGFGKYVADGKYNPKYPTNSTAGAALVLKWLDVNDHVELTHGPFGTTRSVADALPMFFEFAA